MINVNYLLQFISLLSVSAASQFLFTKFTFLLTSNGVFPYEFTERKKKEENSFTFFKYFFIAIKSVERIKFDPQSIHVP